MYNDAGADDARAWIWLADHTPTTILLRIVGRMRKSSFAVNEETVRLLFPLVSAFRYRDGVETMSLWAWLNIRRG